MTDLDAAAPAPARNDDGTFAHADDRSALEAVWDRLNAEPKEPEPAPAPEATEEAPPAAETQPDAPEPEAAEPPKVEAPREIPLALAEKWGALDEPTREAVLTSWRDMNRRMADQGRVVQAAKPVYDVLVEAARQMPGMAALTPAQVAQEAFKAAQMAETYRADPLRTVVQMAHQAGVLNDLKAVLNGQQLPPQAQRPAAPALDPRALDRMVEERVHQTLATKTAEQTVAEFAAGKPFWGDVESDIPTFISLAQKQRPGASPKDVLETAYDMAVHARPDLRAKVIPAAQAPVRPDPARVAEQLAARSVNVPASRPSKPRPLSDRDAMAAVWDRNHG